MNRLSAFVFVCLCGCWVADAISILPQNTAPGVVTTYLRQAAKLKDAASLAAALAPAMPQFYLASTSALPCERPTYVHKVTSLNQDQWSTAALPNGGIRLTINHEPITGVTAKMVQWAWSNLDKIIKVPGSDLELPLFLLMHPIDHVSLSVSSTPIQVMPNAPWTGTELRVQGFAGTGCKAVTVSGRPGVSCPRKKAPAFVCDSREDALRNVPSYDVPYSYFASIEPTNITMIGTWDKLKIWTSSHILTEGDGQLSCQTTYQFGTGGLLGRALNKFAMSRTLAANMDGDIEKTLPFYVVHEVQEFGFFPQWLPDVYNTYAQP